MLKRLINWIYSCFSGSIAVSDQSGGKVKVDIADKRARDRGFRGKLKKTQFIHIIGNGNHFDCGPDDCMQD